MVHPRRALSLGPKTHESVDLRVAFFQLQELNFASPFVALAKQVVVTHLPEEHVKPLVAQEANVEQALDLPAGE